MNIKLNLVIILLLYSGTSFGQKKSFTIQGHIGSLDAPAKIYLRYQDKDGIPITDSAILSGGAFTFKGQISGPLKAGLLLTRKPWDYRYFDGFLDDIRDDKDVHNWGNDLLTIYVEPGNIGISSADSLFNAKVTGTRLNEELSAYTRSKLSLTREKKSIGITENSLMEQSKLTYATYLSMDSVYNVKANEERVMDLHFANAHPASLTSLFFVDKYTKKAINLAELNSTFNKLSPAIRNSTFGNDVKKALIRTKGLEIGTKAPEFTQNDTLGHPIRLSDFRGKYVFIDFWASWCAPCRAENPSVVNAYNLFKDKSFTVIGVSLDKPYGKDSWLKAIQQDNLGGWTQLSDLKGSGNAVANLYHIDNIPQNVLLDPQGRIIAKNLKGTELIDLLTKKIRPTN